MAFISKINIFIGNCDNLINNKSKIIKVYVSSFSPLFLLLNSDVSSLIDYILHHTTMCENYSLRNIFVYSAVVSFNVHVNSGGLCAFFLKNKMSILSSP
jgi:hypothetical protein